MGNGIGKFTNITKTEQLVVHDCTGRSLHSEPTICFCYSCFSVGKIVQQIDLKNNQYVIITDEMTPERNRIVVGPCVVRLDNPWETIQPIQNCPVLDQDDYIVVTAIDGNKRTIRGPGIYNPTYGDSWNQASNAVTVPVNHYIVVNDNNDSANPVKHVKGPFKFIPEPYQTLYKDAQQTSVFKCWEVNTSSAIHLQKANGSIVLIDEPTYYMPAVGETLVRRVDKTVLLNTEFCIVKGNDGQVTIIDGEIPQSRSFFLKPFDTFVEFDMGNHVTSIKLSKLPQFVSHKFVIRTSDNVLLELDLRISYQIANTMVFGANPINFYQHIINWTQNELLDVFSKVNLRDFMKCYTSAAIDSIPKGATFFSTFGINIIDIQIINYICQDAETQRLLARDIQTNVIKQNELKAKEADVAIKERENEIMIRNKEMEVVMEAKNNEVELKKKQLSVVLAEEDNKIALKKKELDVQVRLRELELQTEEERKRTELVALRRDNSVMEGGAEGKSQGMSIALFMESLGDMPLEDKLKTWFALRDLEKAHMLYSKVDQINMYPPNADIKLWQVGSPEDIKTVKDSINRTLPIPQILGYSANSNNTNN